MGREMKYATKEDLRPIMEQGKKYDADKTRWDLLPLDALEGAADILTFGAKKYSAHNWRLVENAEDRYFSALMRHIKAHRMGGLNDPETGKPHVDHALACMLFLSALAKSPPVSTGSVSEFERKSEQSAEESGTTILTFYDSDGHETQVKASELIIHEYLWRYRLSGGRTWSQWYRATFNDPFDTHVEHVAEISKFLESTK